MSGSGTPNPPRSAGVGRGDIVSQITSDLNTLEGIQADLATIATRDDAQRRHDLIQLRRDLAAQIANIGKVADPYFASLPDPGLYLAFRERFSRMRSAAAIHQASWPAVTLGDDPGQYQKSANSVREANHMFINWMRAQLSSA
ncbi:MAG: hypothetical protein JWL96_213 [Sphingomonas bacterium]|uniref:hypothetical protein n=1 Tax=Sphingomonas bacterium TaxID=1895847 RepID=UPI0026049DE1|nr:hypothetical protein [Sphingomonas bacterium]MDB5708143.1 hypothetical protein [Sphingomonas bacterium]